VQRGAAYTLGTARDWMLTEYDEDDASRAEGWMYWTAVEAIRHAVGRWDDEAWETLVWALRSTDEEFVVGTVKTMRAVEDALAEMKAESD
jgi:hypothetical protein